MLQASSTAVAFFYSPYVPYPYIAVIAMFFMSLGLVFLIVLDKFVQPFDAKPITDDSIVINQ